MQFSSSRRNNFFFFVQIYCIILIYNLFTVYNVDNAKKYPCRLNNWPIEQNESIFNMKLIIYIDKCTEKGIYVLINYLSIDYCRK